MPQIYTIVLALLGLGFLVFIHELGHYIVAKRQKMKIEVFSIGFGPAIFKFKFQDVDWQICPLLFGGYVKIAGMEKTDGIEPHKIKDGFYAKSPWSRIKVALAGPIVNIVFALLAFTGIWFLGGRLQNFEEGSQRIGWIDPQSELYKQNVRPGDRITQINGKNYSGIKDLLQAGISKDQTVNIKGQRIDYFSGKETPFDLTVTPYSSNMWNLKGVKSIGVMTSARYLIYNGFPKEFASKVEKVLPLAKSGIQASDRLVWAGGKLLFSPYDLHQIVNDGKVLVTAQRGGAVFQTRVDRLMIKDLDLSQEQRDDYLDAKRDVGMTGALKDLHVLPFTLQDNLLVKGSVERLDGNHSSKDLLIGDKILAIEDVRVSNRLELLKSLMNPKILMIVKKTSDLKEALPFSQRHDLFKDFSFSDLEKIVKGIGLGGVKSVNDFRLLSPMTPITKKQLIDVIAPDHKNPIENPNEKLIVGIPLSDRKVVHNPNPFVMCKNIVSEMATTFSSLFSGKVSPKWLSGPVGIVRIIHHGFSISLKEALYWLGLISLNLGLMNLLPIPVLDGGHICFSLYEVVARKRLSYKTQQKLIVPFFALLLFFFVYVTYQDISRLIT